MAVHAVLNELEQPFTLAAGRDANGEKTAELLTANPRGKVPTLVTPTGHTIREGGAIISYLADTHANGSTLWPASGDARALAQEWLAFANSSLHPAYSAAMFLKRNNAPAELQATHHQNIVGLWNDIEQQLSKTTYLAGENLTPGDILATVIANWQSYISQAITFGPHTTRWLAAVTARPAFQKTLATEEVPHVAAVKAAA